MFYQWKIIERNKKTEERQILHGVIKACTYNVDNHQNLNFIRKLLGLSTGTFYKSIGSETEDTTYPASYCHIKRHKCEANSTYILQKKSILRFYHSDDSSTIDSNSKRIVETKMGDVVFWQTVLTFCWIRTSWRV